MHTYQPRGIALVDLINSYRTNTGEDAVAQPLLIEGVLALDACLRKARIWPVYFADYCLTASRMPLLERIADQFGQRAKTERLWRRFSTDAAIFDCGEDVGPRTHRRVERRADPFLLGQLEHLIDEGWGLPAPDAQHFACVVSNDRYRDWTDRFPIATADRDADGFPAAVVPFVFEGRRLSLPKLGLRTFCWPR